MRNRTLSIFLVFASISIAYTEAAIADVEWRQINQLTLKNQPLAVSSSPDGQKLYILTPGEVLVYSVPENKVTSQISVDKTIDHLAYSSTANTLILSSRTEKSVKIIQLEDVHRFALDGLPFKGAEKAGSVIAVFSDYQ